MAAISNYYGMRAATYHEIDPQYMKLQLKPYWYLYSTIFCLKIFMIFATVVGKYKYLQDGSRT